MAWPNLDLKMHNPYDFPVVLHYVVAAGETKVEILGKERPYDKVVFERKITEQTPYETEERPDETMPVGSSIHDQPGFDGYKLTRYRRMYKDGVEVKTDKWFVKYSPVTEYLRVGTNPDTTLPPPEQPKIQMPKKPSDGSGRLSQ